ncbi:YdgH/BhsA/McbA-like domain containing protein, partial [Pantoea agglomerans]
HFGTPTEISEEVAKRAADKGAKFSHVTRQWQNQSGGNLTVTADLFK